MNLKEIRTGAIANALDLLPAGMNSQSAIIMLLAIGLQESRFTHRRQIGGPARGFWQFELGGGVRGVLRHTSTAKHAAAVCVERGFSPTEITVYSSLALDDVLAAAFARLLLWSDPNPLPEISDVEGAWNLYIRTWRPGKPHRHTWDQFYEQSLKEVLNDHSPG